MNKFLSIVIVFLVVNTYAQQQFSVYFDSNKYETNATETKKLQRWIYENPSVKIVAINGYTDEDGTNIFNDSLAKKRVDFIFKLVKDKIKIREDFKTRSFGENFKQSKIKEENRKAIIYYLLAKDIPKENEILGIKPEVSVTKSEKKNIKYPEKMIFENPDGTKSEYDLDVKFMNEVTQAKIGDKLKIENLNFVVNTFIVVQSSRKKLYELLLVMQNNPDLKIEIQGHLCCQPIDRVNLSTQRAQSVYKFLVANGIDKTRLSYKGFGSTQPIYSLPEKNEEERAANRRVEILVVQN